MNFWELLEEQLNPTTTENGARGYSTTKKALLDMNFKVSSYRGLSDEKIIEDFEKACAENFQLAIVWLFFARDVRGGMGERRIFRVIMEDLAHKAPVLVIKMLPLIAEYGRWDDVIYLYQNSTNQLFKENVVKFLKQQLYTDLKSSNPSLLAKWMPSINSKSRNTRKLAMRIVTDFKLSEKVYRKIMVFLRNKINIVEQQMSAQKWHEIDYEKVSSKANLLYNEAFLRHDESRRRAFLKKVHSGEAKINSSTIFPYEIVRDYVDIDDWDAVLKKEDKTLEALWKNLPDYVNGKSNTLTVLDTSGSMWSENINQPLAANVANALAIYFSERMEGIFRNKIITFSRNPQYINLKEKDTLRGKIAEIFKHSEIANTNIEAVFDLILNTAVENRLPQDEMPESVIILSDMEFDRCAVDDSGRKVTERLFDKIQNRFKQKGFLVPKLIFWNINSRTNVVPMRENELGVILVSGFSPAIADMVFSEKNDPYEALVETLNRERYDKVREILQSLYKEGKNK